MGAGRVTLKYRVITPRTIVTTSPIFAAGMLPNASAPTVWRIAASAAKPVQSCSRTRLHAQGEGLAHHLLRDLPQTLGVLEIERVRLDAVESIGRIVHCRDVAILEVESPAPLELGRGSA